MQNRVAHAVDMPCQLVRNDQRAEPTSVSCGIQLRCTVGTEFDVGDLTRRQARHPAAKCPAAAIGGENNVSRRDKRQATAAQT